MHRHALSCLLFLVGATAPARADGSLRWGFNQVAEGQNAHGVAPGNYTFRTEDQWNRAGRLRELYPLGRVLTWLEDSGSNSGQTLLIALVRRDTSSGAKVVGIERVFTAGQPPRIVVSILEPQTRGTGSGQAPFQIVGTWRISPDDRIEFRVIHPGFQETSLQSRSGADTSTVTVLRDGQVTVELAASTGAPGRVTSGRATKAELEELNDAIQDNALGCLSRVRKGSHRHQSDGFELKVSRVYATDPGKTVTLTIEDKVGEHEPELTPLLHVLQKIRDRIATRDRAPSGGAIGKLNEE